MASNESGVPTKDEVVQVRMTWKLKMRLLELAEEDAKRLSEYVRLVLEEHAKGPGRAKQRIGGVR